MRWSGGVVSTLVNFNGDMTIQTKKEAFLANSINKQRFIIMLSDRLHASGCRTIHAEGDADTVIVQTTVRCADNGGTVVVGEDTDLLALLCYPLRPSHPTSTSDLTERPRPKTEFGVFSGCRTLSACVLVACYCSLMPLLVVTRHHVCCQRLARLCL